MARVKRKWYQKIWRFIYAVMCAFEAHDKKYEVGGYKCHYCGRDVKGYKFKKGE